MDHLQEHDRFVEMDHFYEGVLTPEEERNGIGLMLFKPDATNVFLEAQIQDFVVKELEKQTGKRADFFGFVVVHLDEDMVRKLYNEEKHDEYLKYIADHFKTGPILIALVAARNAPQELNKVKGSIKTGQGVRGVFGMSKPLDESTLNAWKSGRLDEKTTKAIGIDLFASNLIHVPDDKSDTMRVINLLYSKKDIQGLLMSVPFFRRWYKS